MAVPQRDVRFTPKSGHPWRDEERPLCAKSGHAPPHSNTSLARPLVIAALLGIFILREHLTLRKATGLVMALAALTALARS